jgi:eukaryotic-like serine/threonine-protein kinase
MFVKEWESDGPEAALLDSPRDQVATSWSPDNRFLLYMERESQTDPFDLWLLPLEGDRTPFPLLQTPFSELMGQFSPDGRWVAYHSGASGRHEIFVRAFRGTETSPDGTAARWQVSAGGGIIPQWHPEGTALYYIAPNADLMEVPVDGRGAALELGTPRVLFTTRVYGGGRDSGQGANYSIARDGRILINSVVEEVAAGGHVTLIQNWTPAR